MGIRDLFSSRSAKQAKHGTPDVYQYDTLPNEFRVKVVHIWERSMARFLVANSVSMGAPPFLAELVERQVAEAHGLFPPLGREREAFNRLANYFLRIQNTKQALDVIEAVFNGINEHIRPYPGLSNYIYSGSIQHPDDAISDLNQRFLEYAIGYQYIRGQIVRIDSQYIHSESVKPALTLLSLAGFEGSQDEFLRAHSHYREKRYKESINEALKAFESALKTICDQRAWQYDKDKDTANKLLALVMDKELVPSFLQTSFSGLRAVLENAVPTTRNRTSGHGQGAVPLVVPDYFAAYVLHMTASNIVFLIEAHRAKK